MMCYRGMTFCVFRECAEFSTCPVAYTEEVDLESKVWWRIRGGKGDPPVSYADRSTECFPEKIKKGDSDELCS